MTEQLADLTLTLPEWDALLARLYERDDRLDLKVEGETYPASETVDPYVLSGHAEALQSAEVDGDLWGTLEDIEEEAASEDEAWAKISAFYRDRGCVLLRVTGTEEPEEWIFLRRSCGGWAYSAAEAVSVLASAPGSSPGKRPCFLKNSRMLPSFSASRRNSGGGGSCTVPSA